MNAAHVGTWTTPSRWTPHRDRLGRALHRALRHLGGAVLDVASAGVWTLWALGSAVLLVAIGLYLLYREPADRWRYHREHQRRLQRLAIWRRATEPDTLRLERRR